MNVFVTTVVMATVAWHLACVTGTSHSNRVVSPSLSLEEDEEDNQEETLLTSPLLSQLPSSGLEKQLLSAIAERAAQRMKVLLESVASRRSGSSAGAEYEMRKRSPSAGQQGRRYDAYGVAGRFGKRNL